MLHILSHPKIKIASRNCRIAIKIKSHVRLHKIEIFANCIFCHPTINNNQMMRTFIKSVCMLQPLPSNNQCGGFKKKRIVDLIK